MKHHDQSTDQGINDRDTLSFREQNGVTLRRVASTEATRCTDPSHYALTIRIKDNSNELILAIRSIHGRAKIYTVAKGGDLELLLQIWQ
jgi:hypothetical protein